MNVFASDRRNGEQRFIDHAEIAVRVILRHEAFVAPEPVHILPWKSRDDRLHGQQFVKAARCRSAREADRAGAAALLHRAEQPLGDAPRQRFGIVEGPQLAGGTHGARPLCGTAARAANARGRIQRSTASANPSSSLLAVTNAADRCTAGSAFPIAIASAATANIAMSLRPSPMAAIAGRGMSSSCDKRSSACPLFASGWVTSR